MSLLTISFAYLRSRLLGTILVATLLALGIATITVLMLVTAQLEERMQRDARGIDLVAGAKGSPLQIILSAIYHLDVPTGNISLARANEIARHRLVRRAIPLALGDSFHGFRIVGTNTDYPALYGAGLAAGTWWNKPLEAVLGSEVAAQTGLGPGATFAGAHGLGEGGGEHGDARYKVVGVLAPTGSVIDAWC
jgi:putative ABC transport system permease protein